MSVVNITKPAPRLVAVIDVLQIVYSGQKLRYQKANPGCSYIRDLHSYYFAYEPKAGRLVAAITCGSRACSSLGGSYAFAKVRPGGVY
ncbi:hypothetical protein HYN43_000525 [Mucilaginibacter celer]|uniref:Uncharacterized protein n=1 Tax=Mucilaginibacter celer TaxID=2305508 RepID=A0A494VKB5_9SPHI|nr:hypothetical protein HYN43_000525 [Mucilaginibacter celer]